MHKTFAAFDLAGSLMTMTSFAGHPVLRQGGTLWLAAEGQGQVRVRLEAIGREKVAKAGTADGAKEIDPKRMPFVWRTSCPRLSGDRARAELDRLIAAAAKEMRKKFDLPLALVVIDASRRPLCSRTPTIRRKARGRSPCWPRSPPSSAS